MRGAARALTYSLNWRNYLEEIDYDNAVVVYMYSHSMMAAISICKIMMDISYDTFDEYLAKIEGEDKMPHDTTVWKRDTKEMPTFGKDSSVYRVQNKTLHIVVDPIGMKSSDRGELMRGTWDDEDGFLKLHMLVDLDTEQMLAFDLTDMYCEDAARLFKLLSNIKKYHMKGPIPLSSTISYMMQDVMSSQVDHHQTRLVQWMPDDENSTIMEGTGTIEVCRVGPILIEKCEV